MVKVIYKQFIHTNSVDIILLTQGMRSDKIIGKPMKKRERLPKVLPIHRNVAHESGSSPTYRNKRVEPAE